MKRERRKRKYGKFIQKKDKSFYFVLPKSYFNRQLSHFFFQMRPKKLNCLEKKVITIFIFC